MTSNLFKYRLIIFDADGTLRKCTIPGQPCPNKHGEWVLMPNVQETLSSIRWGSPFDGCIAYGIASNQAGVALGYMSPEMAYDLLKETVIAAFGGWPGTGTIQLCPHGVDEGCVCRKPETFMIVRLLALWKVYLEQTLFVGDMESDKQTAINAGVDFMWAKDFFGWEEMREG